MTREEKQKAIDALKISAPVKAMTQEEFNDYIQTINQIMDWLEQEPKTGRWILTDDDFVYCSECEDSYYPRPIDASWYYCPHCGAKMVEPQEGSEE